MNTVKVIAIPVESRQAFDKNIESLKKLAKKLDRPLPIVTTTDVYKYTKVVHNENDINTSFIVDVFDCEIELEQTLKLDGNWNIIGKDDHARDYIFMLDVDREIPNNYSPNNHICEHCRTNHQKSKSFILENKDTNEIKQVGSSCLHKFLSVKPESYISMLSILKEQIDIISSYKGKSPAQSQKAISLDLIWTLTEEVVREDGSYIKALYIEDEYSRNRDKVRSNRGEATYEKVSERLEEKIEINLETTKNIREFLHTIKPIFKPVYQGEDENGEDIYEDMDVTSDYMLKIAEFKDAKNCRLNELSLAVSVYSSYLNYLKELARIENAKNFDYVGVVGEKIPVKLTIKTIKFIENEWGGSNLYKLEDEKGNKFTKFGTINAKFLVVGGENVEEGSVVECLAEVKNHEEFRCEKQTVLGRLSKIK